MNYASFDALCRFAERYPGAIPHSNFKKWAKEAAIFDLLDTANSDLTEASYGDWLKQTIKRTEDPAGDFARHGHMPYPVVFVPLRGPAPLFFGVLLIDDYLGEGKFNGTDSERLAPAAYSIIGGYPGRDLTRVTRVLLSYRPPSPYLDATRTSLDYHAVAATEVVDGALNTAASTKDSSAELSTSNAVVAFCALSLLCDPAKYILETNPVKQGFGKPDLKKIPRSHQRPAYTLIEPGKIRRILHPNVDAEISSGRAAPCPHYRRAHLRRLTSERFTEARGKTVMIPSVWVGPEQRQEGNKLYRVILDR